MGEIGVMPPREDAWASGGRTRRGVLGLQLARERHFCLLLGKAEHKGNLACPQRKTSAERSPVGVILRVPFAPAPSLGTVPGAKRALRATNQHLAASAGYFSSA